MLLDMSIFRSTCRPFPLLIISHLARVCNARHHYVLFNSTNKNNFLRAVNLATLLQNIGVVKHFNPTSISSQQPVYLTTGFSYYTTDTKCYYSISSATCSPTRLPSATPMPPNFTPTATFGATSSTMGCFDSAKPIIPAQRCSTLQFKPGATTSCR